MKEIMYPSNLLFLGMHTATYLPTCLIHHTHYTAASSSWSIHQIRSDMGLLKHIQMKGAAGVNLTSSLLAEHEHEHEHKHEDTILDQGGGGDHLEIIPPQRSSVFGSETELEPMVIEEKQTLSDGGKQQQQQQSGSSLKRRKLVFSESSESSDQADHETGPGSPVKEIEFSESDESSNESDLNVLDRVRCLSQLVGSVPGLVTSWYEKKVKREAHLRDRIARYRLRMAHQAAKNAKLAKKVRKRNKMGTIEKGQDAIQMLAKNAIEHGKVVEALQSELEKARDAYEKLKQANEKLEQEKDGMRQERVALEKSLEQASSDRQWLIQEGFEYVVNRLHRSQEYLGLLGAVQSNLWNSGAHYGLVQCYESYKDGVPLEDASLYNPEAHEKFLKAVHELEHTRFPYIAALSQSADRSLDDLRALEPRGLEQGDEVAVTGGGNVGD